MDEIIKAIIILDLISGKNKSKFGMKIFDKFLKNKG
jgi:hypothetical protein